MQYRSFFASALALAVSLIFFALPANAAFTSRESVSVCHHSWARIYRKRTAVSTFAPALP